MIKKNYQTTINQASIVLGNLENTLAKEICMEWSDGHCTNLSDACNYLAKHDYKKFERFINYLKYFSSCNHSNY